MLRVSRGAAEGFLLSMRRNAEKGMAQNILTEPLPLVAEDFAKLCTAYPQLIAISRGTATDATFVSLLAAARARHGTAGAPPGFLENYLCYFHSPRFSVDDMVLGLRGGPRGPPWCGALRAPLTCTRRRQRTRASAAAARLPTFPTSVLVAVRGALPSHPTGRGNPLPYLTARMMRQKDPDCVLPARERLYAVAEPRHGGRHAVHDARSESILSMLLRTQVTAADAVSPPQAGQAAVVLGSNFISCGAIIDNPFHWCKIVAGCADTSSLTLAQLQARGSGIAATCAVFLWDRLTACSALGRAEAGLVTFAGAYSQYSAFNGRIHEHAQLEFALTKARAAQWRQAFVHELAGVIAQRRVGSLTRGRIDRAEGRIAHVTSELTGAIMDVMDQVLREPRYSHTILSNATQRYACARRGHLDAVLPAECMPPLWLLRRAACCTPSLPRCWAS